MSDHLSGPRAVADPATDITDFYAFPSPSWQGQLVLVMDVFAFARPGALFSDAANYRFRVRTVTIPASGPGARFAVGMDEYAITCTFAAPDGPGPAVQEGACTLPNGASVSFRVNNEEGGQAHGVRVFAGLRMDPNFADTQGYTETAATRRLAFRAKGTNQTADANILSIVVELDVATVLGSAPGALFAVAAETTTADKLPLRLERFGRASIKNGYLAEYGVDTVNRDLDLRDLYNQEDPFQLAPYYLGAYRARLNANLHFFDGLDGKIDWPLQPDGTHPLTELLLADFQVVDVAKPFAEDGYLEIERALLEGRAHATCGGRSLNNDAQDTMATLIYTGGNGPRISDGVDQATVPASQSFPYLAPPNLNPPVVNPAMAPSKVADLLGVTKARGIAPPG